jgi:tetratricopeptide (TPR) repeat protein
VVLQEDGRYENAAQAYRRVLHDFPADRATWRNLGRVLYLDSEYEEALKALGQALEIDPEDRIAYYHQMLALRALGRMEEANLAETAYEYYQVDESAQEVTRQYRLQHEHDNREVLKIHVHPLEEVERGRG